jgi:hypothetical protein
VFGVLASPPDQALGLVSVKKPTIHTSTAFFSRTVPLTSDDHHTVFQQSGARVYDLKLDHTGDNNVPSGLAMTFGLQPLQLALFAVRVIAPVLVFLSALSVIPRKATSNQPSPITSVVVKSQEPRRGLILSFLTLASISYFSDGITFVVYAVINKHWPPLSAIEIGAVLGVVAYGGLAALGAYKDINGLNIWSFASVKYAIFLALVFDTTLVVLLATMFQSGLLDPYLSFRHRA